jgi:hypothetical protein
MTGQGVRYLSGHVRGRTGRTTPPLKGVSVRCPASVQAQLENKSREIGVRLTREIGSGWLWSRSNRSPSCGWRQDESGAGVIMSEPTPMETARHENFCTAKTVLSDGNANGSDSCRQKRGGVDQGT